MRYSKVALKNKMLNMYPDITKNGLARRRIAAELKTTSSIFLPDEAWDPCETTNPDSVMRALINVNKTPISLYAVEIIESNGCPDATSQLGAKLFSKIPYRADYSLLEIKGKKYLLIACPFPANQSDDKKIRTGMPESM